jgi:hypothetical protein
MRGFQVSPWYSYFLVHLPKITLFSLPLATYALITRTGAGLRGLAVSTVLGLVGGMSCLGHKVCSYASIEQVSVLPR